MDTKLYVTDIYHKCFIQILSDGSNFLYFALFYLTKVSTLIKRLLIMATRKTIIKKGLN